MIEENGQDSNGGVNPSGTGEEYRKEGRYSVPSVSGDGGDSSAGKKKDGEPVEGGPEGEASPSGRRPTREELESQYRDDPRFNMLFNHGVRKNGKKATRYIKVGSIRLTPKRILILCGFLLAVLLCLGFSLFYAFKDIGKIFAYRQAREVFESGDYEKAKDLLAKVISDDPNKEDANEMLAQIYHRYQDWGNEAFLRQRLMRLEPLNEERFRDFLNTSFRARNFGTIYSHLNLKVMENPELPPEDGALYVISALHSDHVPNAKLFYSERTKGNPTYFSDTETGRYAELLLKASELNREKALDIIDSHSKIQNEQIRFETINTLLYFLAKQEDRESDEQMEKLLWESVELNEYAGVPLLANYLFSHYRFEETIKVCEAYLKTKMNAVIPILYGEACVLTGHPEKIASLSAEVRKLHGRQSRIISSYLDALNAFSSEDETRLRALLMDAGSLIETPLSMLMRLRLAIEVDSSKEILMLLESILKEEAFWDFPQRARTVALDYLVRKVDSEDLLKQPDELSACAGIASLLETPGDDVSFLRRIVLLDRFKRNLLKEEELQNSLKSFPGDSVLLRIAAEYYLLHNQPARAMDYLDEYNSIPGIGKNSTIAVMYVLALDQLGRKEEAEKEFRGLVEKESGGPLLYLYYDFCIENRYMDSLKSLLSWLESLPKDSASRAAIPFVNAEILLAEGKKDQAFSLFESAKSVDPQFVFHAAERLAEGGRNEAAVKRYLSILDTCPDKTLVYLNLSELYSKLNDAKNAFECARAAWRENPDSLPARYLYATHLFEAGKLAETVSVLKFPQYRASFPTEMLDLWSKAIREIIKDDFYAGRYSSAMENTKFLLIYFPDDKSGKEYLEKIEKLRRQERKAKP